MTGYEVCRELRDEDGDEMPIFFLSGTRTEPMDRVAGLLLGADDCIAKPFDPAELVARVRRFIQRRNPAVTHGLRLTMREQEILHLLVAGKRQKEIAVTSRSARRPLRRTSSTCSARPGVHSRAELVAHAYLLGLVGKAPPTAV